MVPTFLPLRSPRFFAGDSFGTITQSAQISQGRDADHVDAGSPHPGDVVPAEPAELGGAGLGTR